MLRAWWACGFSQTQELADKFENPLKDATRYLKCVCVCVLLSSPWDTSAPTSSVQRCRRVLSPSQVTDSRLFDSQSADRVLSYGALSGRQSAHDDTERTCGGVCEMWRRAVQEVLAAREAAWEVIGAAKVRFIESSHKTHPL